MCVRAHLYADQQRTTTRGSSAVVAYIKSQVNILPRSFSGMNLRKSLNIMIFCAEKKKKPFQRVNKEKYEKRVIQASLKILKC